jgi:hypothetical protein
MTEIIRKKPPENIRIERNIITGMIISDHFLREIQPLCQSKDFETSYAVKIAGWCFRYYKEYQKAPGKHIEDLYLQNKIFVNEDENNLIQEFLLSISEEYEQADSFNVEYILDKAEEHFRLSALKKLKTELSQAIIGGDVEYGENCVKEYSRPIRSKSKGVDPYRDIDTIIKALIPNEDNPNVLMNLPGDLGKEVGPIERGFLMAIQAESSVGKTWWLWYLAQLASLHFGRNVAFFSMEMSELKMIRRIWQTLAGAPTREEDEILIPVFDCVKNQRGVCTRGDSCGIKILEVNEDTKKCFLSSFSEAPKEYRPCSACRNFGLQNQFQPTSWWKSLGKVPILDPSIGLKRQAALQRSGRLKRAGKFRMIEFPSRKFTMDELIAHINNLEYYENFIPDVIITDYADKLKWRIPGDPRNSIAEIWDSHKSLAADRHCLVITASQSNTMRTGKKVSAGTWGETQEKMNVIDVGIALNQKPEEKKKGQMEVTTAKKRHEDWDKTSKILVLQSLAIGRPYLDSYSF